MGKQSEAQESEQFLLQHTPEDPQHYVELAQLQAQQGNSSEAIESWQRALKLFEGQERLERNGIHTFVSCERNNIE